MNLQIVLVKEFIWRCSCMSLDMAIFLNTLLLFETGITDLLSHASKKPWELRTGNWNGAPGWFSTRKIILRLKTEVLLSLKERTLDRKLLDQQLVRYHRQSNRQQSREGIPVKIPKMLCSQPDRYLSWISSWISRQKNTQRIELVSCKHLFEQVKLPC